MFLVQLPPSPFAFALSPDAKELGRSVIGYHRRMTTKRTLRSGRDDEHLPRLELTK